MTDRPNRCHWLCLAAAALLVLLAGPLSPAARAATGRKLVSYHGYQLSVPASWPVYRLGAGSSTCVRFNRHAVYLGRPGTDQLCPAAAAGRTEAILVQPLGAGASDAVPIQGSAARIVNAAHGVAVTATWNRQPALIAHLLGVRSLAALAHRSARLPRASALARTRMKRSFARARATTTGPASPGQVYTGPGFDACHTPSTSQMSAWSSSPYRAIGVYMGGENAACDNLTSTWVQQESAAGWHIIPIYVGLQAPSNSCGCAAMSSTPATAAQQGAADATTAVADAQAVGIGTGNPLYLDMENYTRTTTNTNAVLAFVQGWTQQLHSSGYASAVYSSESSGIRDLVSTMGTGYTEPDEIWIANWNGQQSTDDPIVPAGDWAAHQRLHQYEGAHNETYSGATINIDGDYVDAVTAAAGSGPTIYFTPTPAPAPTLNVAPAANGTINLTPSWRYATGVASWQILGGQSPSALAPTGAPVPVGSRMPIVSTSAYNYFAVTALGSGGQTLGTSAPVATRPHLSIFGLSTYSPRTGLGGVPVGCFSASPCWVSMSLTRGRRTLTTTRPERVPVGGGLVFFGLTALEHYSLWRAHLHQQLVRVTVHSRTAGTASRPLKLTSFATADPNPPRSLTPSSALRLVGTSDFVSNGWVGGLLAQCLSATPCEASTRIYYGRRLIARTGIQNLGVGEQGYLMFTLTAAGHRLLEATFSNQLPVTAKVTSGGVTATGHLSLSAYN